MKRALVHHCNAKFCEALAQALTGYFPGSQVVITSDAAAFAAAFEGPEPFDAIVVESGGDVKEIPAAAFARGKAPVVVEFGPKGMISGLPAGTTLAGISGDATLTMLFGVLEKNLAKTGHSEFMALPLGTLLLHGSQQHFDIYVKLSDDKFVKVLGKEEVFDTGQYMRFLNKKVNTLYLPQQQFLGLFDKIQDDLASSMLDPSNLDEAIALNQSAISAIQGLFAGRGLTPRVEKMIAGSVTASVSVMKRSPKLADLLAKITKDTSSFLSWHSTALSYLSCNLAAMIDWKSEATFGKLALASLLHDIGLEEDALAKIETKEELAAAGLTADRVSLVLEHPASASKMVAGLKDVPGEVAFIVEQHHELPEGKGFPKGLQDKDISPISALFVISHDLVMELHKSPDSFDLAEFLHRRDQEHRYVKGGFGTVFRGIMANLKTLNRLG